MVNHHQKNLLNEDITSTKWSLAIYFVLKNWQYFLITLILFAIPPIVFVNFSNVYLGQIYAGIKNNSNFTIPMIKFICSYLVNQSSHLIGGYFFAIGLSRTSDQIKKFAFQRVERLKLESFSKINEGELERHITALSEGLCSTLEIFFYNIWELGLTIINVLIVHFLMSRTLFAISSTWVLLIIFIGYFTIKKLIYHNDQVMIARAKQTGLIVDIFKNIVLTKIFRTQKYNEHKFDEIQKTDHDAYSNFTIQIGVQKMFIGMVNIIFFCLSILIITNLKGSTFSDAAIFSIVSLTWDLTFKIWQFLGRTLNIINSVVRYTSSTIIFNETLEHVGGGKISEPIVSIEAKNLVLPINNKTVFNFSINKNDCVLVSGVSGIGKTTLVNALIGIVTPESGRILINGQDLRDIDKNNLLDNVSYLTQSDMILNSSIEDNIKLGREENFQEACINSEINQTIAISGLNYQCGSGGRRLSGGQMKRICLARMLISDKQSNIIVLDEPFSSLDSVNIEKIMIFIKKLHGKRTIITIDHSGLFQQYCNKIIDL